MSDKRKNPAYRYKGEIPATDSPDRPVPGKKDTRRWCKGKVGREHVPGPLTLANGVAHLDAPCVRDAERAVHNLAPYADPSASPEYRRLGARYSIWLGGRCWHQVRCVNCAKVLTDFASILDCPDVPQHSKDQIRALMFAIENSR